MNVPPLTSNAALQLYDQQDSAGEYPWRLAMQKAISLCYFIQGHSAQQQTDLKRNARWLTAEMNKPPSDEIDWTYVQSCSYQTGVYTLGAVANEKPGVIAYSSSTTPPTLLIAFPGMQKAFGDYVAVSKFFSKAIGDERPWLTKMRAAASFVDTTNTAIQHYGLLDQAHRILLEFGQNTHSFSRSVEVA